jgi:hypothetical protein
LYGYLVGYVIGLNILLVFRLESIVTETGKVFIFFFMSYMTRFMTVIIMYPLLKLLGGYELNAKKVAVLTLNNFRSDSLLIMCLVLFFDQGMSQHLRIKMLFWSTISVILYHSLTFFTVRPILRQLDLKAATPAKDKLFVQF